MERGEQSTTFKERDQVLALDLDCNLFRVTRKVLTRFLLVFSCKSRDLVLDIREATVAKGNVVQYLSYTLKDDERKSFKEFSVCRVAYSELQ